MDRFTDAACTILLDEFLPKITLSLAPLSDADTWWRPAESSNSIANLLLHLEGNARQWILSGVRGDPDVRDRDAEFAARAGPGKEALVARFRDTLIEIERVLAGIPADRFDEPRRIQGSDTTIFGAMFRLTTHVAVHTGQIIQLAKWRAPGVVRHYEASSTSFTPLWQPTPRPPLP
ncbi:MAG: DUF1572 family protein [Gemmatimonadaceae bacterium]|nr:DUF1572 family protein [Gemmatimonadaceae bacterium]